MTPPPPPVQFPSHLVIFLVSHILISGGGVDQSGARRPGLNSRQGQLLDFSLRYRFLSTVGRISLLSSEYRGGSYLGVEATTA